MPLSLFDIRFPSLLLSSSPFFILCATSIHVQRRQRRRQRICYIILSLSPTVYRISPLYSVLYAASFPLLLCPLCFLFPLLASLLISSPLLTPLDATRYRLCVLFSSYDCSFLLLCVAVCCLEQVQSSPPGLAPNSA